MGPIDPHEMLKGLESLLGSKGNIKGHEEAERIAMLMKKSVKLVSRCTYVNILNATADESVLQSFNNAGGWDILNNWLIAAKEDDNVYLLKDLLEVYQKMPVTVQLLKQNSCARTIKQLSKSTDAVVKKLAVVIVKMWKKKVQDKQDTSNDRGKEKKHRSEGDDDNHKRRSSKDRLKGEERTSSVDEENSRSPGNELSEDGKFTVRPRTVKTFQTKFRSTGLEQESSLPPSRRKVEEKAPAVPTKRTSSSSIARFTQPKKKKVPTATLR